MTREANNYENNLFKFQHSFAPFALLMKVHLQHEEKLMEIGVMDGVGECGHERSSFGNVTVRPVVKYSARLEFYL